MGTPVSSLSPTTNAGLRSLSHQGERDAKGDIWENKSSALNGHQYWSYRNNQRRNAQSVSQGKRPFSKALHPSIIQGSVSEARCLSFYILTDCNKTVPNFLKTIWLSASAQFCVVSGGTVFKIEHRSFETSGPIPSEYLDVIEVCLSYKLLWFSGV